MELTLDDLIRWQPGRFRPLNLTGNLRERLAIELSWAATIRAGTPVVPQVRGGELIVVPRARLRELAAREQIGWRQILDQLVTLRPSGVLTDDTSVTPPPDLPFLIADEPLPDDIEERINREIIERRGDHYALGSELARDLSAASIRGADLEALLAIAARAGGIQLALVAGSGAIIARSHCDMLPDGLALPRERPGIPVSAEGRDWVPQSVRSMALPEGVVLVAGIEPEAAADRARLMLEQTAEALGMLFDRLPPVETPSAQRETARLLEQIVIDGNLTPVARRRFTHLAADLLASGPLRLVVALEHTESESTAGGLRFRHDDLEIRIVDAAQPPGREEQAGSSVLSAPVEGVEGLAGAWPAAYRVARLMRAGLISPGVVDLGAPGVRDARLAVLLAGLAADAAGDVLRAYADARLSALDAYDRERGAELTRTLGAYLDAGASVAAAARALDVHRNTLAYRIARIEEVGELSLADPATRFDLQLALAIRRVLSDGEPGAP